MHPPHFDQAFAVGYFEGSLREAIHQYKYRPCRALGKPLGKWMAQHIRLLANVDVLIPVPLYVMRLKKRGFNQSLLLVYEIHKAFEIPFSYDNLLRIRPTRAQIELSGEERVKNVAGAFDLRYPGRIAEKNVVLIDDVFTSGATMNECSRVLKKAGASQVIACTLARAF
ncbi:MAG: ComF family protein [Nitrospirota bacterium]